MFKKKFHKMSVCRVLVAGALGFFSSTFAPTDNPLKLWYNTDAGSEFTNALPIGNGYMGGLIYGGVEKDYIGLSLSGHPLDDYIGLLEKNATAKAGDFVYFDGVISTVLYDE